MARLKCHLKLRCPDWAKLVSGLCKKTYKLKGRVSFKQTVCGGLIVAALYTRSGR
jgi:hypothetical protein